MRLLGGPEAVTAYARTLGDATFRLDRWETRLNAAVPGDPRDTTTPLAHAHTYARLLLGDALPAPQRAQLRTWMLGNTTGADRIRAGVPAPWQVADKTGSGAYGSTNDAAVIWRTPTQALTMVIFFTQGAPDAPTRSDVLADAARIVSGAFTGA
jgi:beta-lactamase class A